ncbi:MAG: hypothetical protein JXA99_09775, partial [Candidatus Lokiarchaeota archaeon]|nr:hypothetical protein [Candidatus Lokiarchaeota archaeon]
KQARIAKANAERDSKLRELEVKNEIGIQDQLVEKDIELQRKSKEIAIAEQERERKTIEADGDRQKIIIEANAEAQQIKQKLIAQAEGESEKIKRKMQAQAEGFQKQVESMNNADERFLAVQLVKILPEIFKNMNPEKMFIMGSGDEAFGSLSRAIMPFLQLLPEYSDQIKKLFGNGNGKEKKILSKLLTK